MTVPAAPVGSIVTGMVTLCPGWTTTGVNPAFTDVLAAHRSPVGAVTDRSIGAVTALTVPCAVTAFAPLAPSGPFRNGVTVQAPSAMSGAEKFSDEVLPVDEIRSGSPNGYDRSKKFAALAETCADSFVVSEGTR